MLQFHKIFWIQIHLLLLWTRHGHAKRRFENQTDELAQFSPINQMRASLAGAWERVLIPNKLWWKPLAAIPCLKCLRENSRSIVKSSMRLATRLQRNFHSPTLWVHLPQSKHAKAMSSLCGQSTKWNPRNPGVSLPSVWRASRKRATQPSENE